MPGSAFAACLRDRIQRILRAFHQARGSVRVEAFGGSQAGRYTPRVPFALEPCRFDGLPRNLEVRWARHELRATG
jgi:hypothetical protein